jgi:hypothetical protein
MHQLQLFHIVIGHSDFSIFCLYGFLFFLFCWPILASVRGLRLARQAKDGCPRQRRGALLLWLAGRPEELAISASRA